MMPQSIVNWYSEFSVSTKPDTQNVAINYPNDAKKNVVASGKNKYAAYFIFSVNPIAAAHAIVAIVIYLHFSKYFVYAVNLRMNGLLFIIKVCQRNL